MIGTFWRATTRELCGITRIAFFFILSLHMDQKTETSFLNTLFSNSVARIDRQDNAVRNLLFLKNYAVCIW